MTARLTGRRARCCAGRACIPVTSWSGGGPGTAGRWRAWSRLAGGPGQILIGDKNYYGKDFEAALAGEGLTLLRPARKGEPGRPGAQFFKPLRQVIESVNQTFKAQLDLERHGGRTIAGVTVRVLQRILALTTAIWLNDKTAAQTHRSLIAYDH